MTTREFLGQYQDINAAINLKLAEISQLRCMALRVTGVMSPNKVQGGGQGRGNLEDIIAKLADLDNEVNQDIDRLLAVKHQIEAYIAAVPDSQIRAILTARHINGMSWTDVAIYVGGGNTADSVRMMHKRFMQSCSQCSVDL